MANNQDTWREQPIKDVKVFVEGVELMVFTTTEMQEFISVVEGQGFMNATMKTLILALILRYFAQLSTRLPIKQEASITAKTVPGQYAMAAMKMLKRFTETGFVHATHFSMKSKAIDCVATYDPELSAKLAQRYSPHLLKIEASTLKRKEYVVTLQDTINIESQATFKESLPKKRRDCPIAFVKLVADIVHVLLAPYQRDMLLDPLQERFAIDTFAIHSLSGLRPHEQIHDVLKSAWNVGSYLAQKLQHQTKVDLCHTIGRNVQRMEYELLQAFTQF
ncbi:hypothetical protein BGZ81_003070 [Podila clonocystis]|nr:hypothetical protein BGZ81_003070 [Podila clonocystis]